MILGHKTFRILEALMAGLVMVAILAACTGSSKTMPTPTSYPTPIIPDKPTYIVQLGEVTRKFTANGRVAPIAEQQLAFRVGGRVGELFVKIGAPVTEGQVLAVLEEGERDFDLRRAKGNLEIAQFELEMAKINTSIYARDYSFVIGIKEVQVEMAQLALDEIHQQIQQASLIAPMSGTVLVMTIATGDQVSALNPVMVVADLNALEVSADILSNDLAKLTEGMEVKIFPVSKPGEVLDGKIRRLPYPYGSGSSNSNSPADQSVRISFSDATLANTFTLGEILQIVVILENKVNVLWLPPQAIRTYEGRKFVVIRDMNGQRRVDVIVGTVSEDRVEILDGVVENQVVLAP
jgi:macrolide-specific efflux system membrane fusion protein